MFWSLPPTARIWRVLHDEQQKALKPAVEQIRDRAEHYKRLREQQTEEATG